MLKVVHVVKLTKPKPNIFHEIYMVVMVAVVCVCVWEGGFGGWLAEKLHIKTGL